MRKRLITGLFMIMLLISGCSGDKEPHTETAYDLAGKTYYNTIDEFGNPDHSRIWFGKDGSFVMTDNFAEGSYEISGDWSLAENVVTLDVASAGVGSYTKIIFEAKDDETLILKTTLAGSRSEQVFSIDGNSQEPKDSFNYAVYYNISQSDDTRSYAEIRSDGSFAFIDRNDFGIFEYNGTFTRQDDELVLGGFTGSKPGAGDIHMLVKDDKTLILETDVGVSAVGDVFSSDPSKIPQKPASVPCTGLTSLYHNYWAVEGTSSYSLEVKALPEDTTDTIFYSSDDEKIVKVDQNGFVSPLTPGKTKIHVTCGDQELTLGFETRAKGPSSVEIDEKTLTVLFNSTAQIHARALPATADQTLTYESSDKSIASVNADGVVKGKSPGNAKITVSAKNGVSASLDVCVEGETVIFTMQDNVTLKEASGQTIPYKAVHIACYDGNVSKEDVTEWVEFHTTHTSALDIDGHGNVYAKGYVYESVDIPVYFTYSDGSSFYVTSPTYTVRVEK